MKEIKKNSNDVLINIEKILNDQKVGERIREGFKIAILGPTNAGKSSLLNHLSNRDVAIVSEIAGTTITEHCRGNVIHDVTFFFFGDFSKFRQSVIFS